MSNRFLVVVPWTESHLLPEKGERLSGVYSSREEAEEAAKRHLPHEEESTFWGEKAGIRLWGAGFVREAW